MPGSIDAIVIHPICYITSIPIILIILGGINLLTPTASFGFGGKFADAADLDDFHSMTPDSVWFATSDSLGFNFTVNASVRYIDDFGATSTVPTWIKEVTVTVDGPDNGGRKLLYHPVSVTRQFSPQWY